ncbi:hypothetical protein ACG04R_02540 [Roseateles sp. BYS78W]|uniref:Uncharacterized protein n=1 Tax=Pelomonas candidula TaxID=3299025 RepID=A0ABW7H6L0_9BURK
MAESLKFTPRFWLKAGDQTWYPAPWWANAFPLLDAFEDPSRAQAEQSERALELRRILDQGGLVRSTEPNADHPVSDAVRAVYASAGIAHLLTQH